MLKSIEKLIDMSSNKKKFCLVVHFEIKLNLYNKIIEYFRKIKKFSLNNRKFMSEPKKLTIREHLG